MVHTNGLAVAVYFMLGRGELPAMNLVEDVRRHLEEIGISQSTEMASWLKELRDGAISAKQRCGGHALRLCKLWGASTKTSTTN